MSTQHVVPPGGTRVKFFGPRKPFPRAGAWTIAKGRLGIIYELVTVTDTTGAEVPSANVHFLKPDGTTQLRLDEEKAQVVAGEVFPVSELRIATFDEIRTHARNLHITPFDAAVLGYELNSTDVRSLTALQRRTLNLSLSDEDAAQAEVEQQELNVLAEQRAKVAAHPDAIALEEEIEKERLAFIESVERRRQQMFDKLSSE